MYQDNLVHIFFFIHRHRDNHDHIFYWIVAYEPKLHQVYFLFLIQCKSYITRVTIHELIIPCANFIVRICCHIPLILLAHHRLSSESNTISNHQVSIRSIMFFFFLLRVIIVCDHRVASENETSYHRSVLIIVCDHRFIK